MCHITTEDM